MYNWSKVILLLAVATTSIYTLYVPIPENSLNNRPVIGVLAQECISQYTKVCNSSYIGASYIKYVESGGARAVPIRLNQSDAYYESMFYQINGLLMPGGNVNLQTSGYLKVARKFFEMSKNATYNNDPFPIWGTCLGFQALGIMFSEHSVLSKCEDEDKAHSLNFTSDYKSSRLFGNMSSQIEEILKNENVAVNYHHEGISPQDFKRYRLNEALRILSTNIGQNGKEYISSFEAKDYPFYGVQFHPEKNQYVWVQNSERQNIPHSYHAVLAGQYFINFFVDEVRKSMHKLNSKELLSFNYKVTKTAGVITTMDQMYIIDM